MVTGGMFHDCAVHDIDTICWIVGDYPTSVHTFAHAHVDVIRSLNDVDTVIISMKFRDGTLATIDLSRFAAYGYDQRLEVYVKPAYILSQHLALLHVLNITDLFVLYKFGAYHSKAPFTNLDRFTCNVLLQSCIQDSLISQ